MRRSFGNALGLSAVTHVAVFVLVIFVMSRMPDPGEPMPAAGAATPIVWLPQPGPGGGGGGGGNRMPEPARSAVSPGRDSVTVPAPRPAQPSMSTAAAPPVIDAPVVPLASGLTDLPGVVSGIPSGSPSLGPGTGGAGGPGHGGVGPGDGPGLGPGRDGGTGGGPRQPGGDISFPQLIREVAPSYTNAALQARIQGIVELRAEVRADGSVGQVWITRSLDGTFGLDQEAIRCVQQWRFVPARQGGKPVTVVVPIELRFTIR